MGNVSEKGRDIQTAVRAGAADFARRVTDLRDSLGSDWAPFFQRTRYWLDRIERASTVEERAKAADGLVQLYLEHPLVWEAFADYLSANQIDIQRAVRAGAVTFARDLSGLRDPLGGDWSAFNQRAQHWLDRIERASTEEERAVAADGLVRLFLEHPVVWALFAGYLIYGTRPVVDMPSIHVAEVVIEEGEELELWEIEKRARRTMQPGPRYTNVDLVDQTKAHRCDDAWPLATGTTYHLRIDIGPLRKDSVVKNPKVFPDRQLPPTEEGHWLDVVVTSDDFDIETEQHALFLPNSGASWVCDCGRNSGHHCTPEERKENRHLYVPVTSPVNPGETTLRIGFYYRNNLLESQLFTARVGLKVAADRAGYESEIDYTLTRALTDLAQFAPRALSIFANQNADGTHRVIAVAGEHIRHAPLTDETVRKLLQLARQTLHDMHRSKTLLGWDNKFQTLQGADGQEVTNAKEKKDFIKDLKTLARVGSLLYRTVFPGIQQDAALRQLLRDRGTIQTGFSGSGGAPLLVPWALFYDIDIDPYHPQDDPADWRVCELVNQWELGRTLAGAAAARCPYDNGDDHGKDVICPFGFWGFKHLLEYLPSWGGKPPDKIARSDGKPEMVVGYSGGFSLAADHIKLLGQELDVELRADSSKDNILTLMADPDLEFVYFFCHGRLQEFPDHAGEPWLSTPYLAVGPKGREERITDRDLKTWKGALPATHWQKTAPLVFINGCHTAELSPDDLINFVYRFIDANANGVIGTEVVVSQDLASEIAMLFFGHFLQQDTPISEAVRRVRLDFLAKGNIMALAYTPYCDADLHLE